ncbi:aminoglycoside 6-adenylyltransferase [Leptospira bouyouniensis]|uniref:aminoglycoside 6-adenylyltransferase n=1 Tax=Leptospira bouyouniensis TaxID=2484911 RepID=UPI0010911A28|nr:aminoglycoside 6-adenylyltransferase [Leptospira bouyouniensis]TGM74776.1 nucleotidyltransferase domain-containing protein [Leptospira bouyouniensis]
MKHFEQIIERVIEVAKNHEDILGVCLAGSYINKETDIFSDLDFVIITKNNSQFSISEMTSFAKNSGDFLIGFTGEHVGENKLLICLFDNPVTHIDFKFTQLKDFYSRIENPVIIYDKSDFLENIYKETVPLWPKPDLQWIENRFWVWIHYAATKLGRKEFFETIDFISFLRANVIGPLFHLKYNKDPRGVRKLEFFLDQNEISQLRKTIPNYSFESIKDSLMELIEIYRNLRSLVFTKNININFKVEEIAINYLEKINQ